MKKRVLLFMLCGLLLLGITGCGNDKYDSLTKEEMLRIAQDITGKGEDNTNKTNSFFIDLSNNNAKAEEQKGKVYIMDDDISKIEKDYFEFDYGMVKVRIYLPTSSLAELSNDEHIKIIGQLTDIIKEEQLVAGMKYNDTIFVFKNCYIY